MNNYLDKIFILEGIVLAILGVLFFINPVDSFMNLATIIGILMIVVGVVRIVRAFKTDSKMFFILTGIIDILFGLMVLASPVFVLENIILFYGIYAFIKGIYTLIVVIKDKSFGFNAPTLLSIVSIVLGGIVLLYPVVTIIALPFVPYFIGAALIVSAITEIYVGFKM